MNEATRRAIQRSAWLFGIALLGWGAWLSFPRQSRAADQATPLTAIVIDSSASATSLRTGWRVHLRRALRELVDAAGERADEVLIVDFAADVQRRIGPESAALAKARLTAVDAMNRPEVEFGFPRERSLETRLGAALSLVERELAERPQAQSRIVLYGDGFATDDGAEAILFRLAQDGVAIEAHPLAESDATDLDLRTFELAPRLELSAPMIARVQVVANGFDAARHEVMISLLIREGDEDRKKRFTLELPAAPQSGTTHFVDLGPTAEGNTLVEARLELRARDGGGPLRDAIPENDTASGEVRSASSLRALILCQDVVAARQFLGSAPVGIEFRFRNREDYAGELEGADLCVTVDVPLYELDFELFRSFLQRGGGLLVTGGTPLLHDWGSSNSADLARLLPLTPSVDDLPPRDVQFVVDGSGSMRGKPFAAVRDALIELAPVTPVRDRVSLRFFTGALQPPTVLATGENDRAEDRAERARRVLSRTVPGGQTFLLDSLEGLLSERANATVEGLVLLLTDGRETSSFRAMERARELADKFPGSNTRLEILAVGEEPDLELLDAMLPEDEDPTRVRDFADLSVLFQRKVNRERTEFGPFALALPPRPNDDLAREVHASLKANSLPRLGAALRMQENSSGTVLLRSENGNPVLAVQRVGLGKAAVLATGPGTPWAGELTVGGSLQGLLRVLGRDAQAERALRVRVQPARPASITIENVPSTWPPRARVRILRFGADSEKELEEVSASLPTRDLCSGPLKTRHVTWPRCFETLEPGAPLVFEIETESGEALARLSGRAPGPPELVRSRAIGALPERRPVDESERDLRSPDPRAPYLLLGGLGLLFLAGLGSTGRFGGRAPRP